MWLNRWRRRHWPLILFWVGLIAAGLVALGYGMQKDSVGINDWLRLPYHIAQIFSLNFDADAKDIKDNLPIIVATILATLFVVSSIFSLIVHVFRLQWIDFMNWAFHRRIVVICGLGHIGAAIVRDYADKRAEGGASVVVIEKDPQNRHIQACREIGAFVLQGDATEPDFLERARSGKAHRVFAVTGSDAGNIEVAMKLCSNRKGNDAPVCHLHLTDALHAQLVEEACRHKTERASFNLPHIRTFNIYRDTARHFVNNRLLSFMPKEGQTIHFVLIGFGRMGQELALQLVRQAHFTNNKRLRMTIFADKVDQKAFLSRHPAFCPEPETVNWANLSEPIDYWDCTFLRPHKAAQVTETHRSIAVEYACNAQFQEIPLNVRALDFENLPLKKPKNSHVNAFIVCSEDDRYNFEIALELKEVLRLNKADSLPFYTWLPRLTGLADLLDEIREKSPPTHEETIDESLSPIISFGKTEKICCVDEILHERQDSFAAKIHQAHQNLVRRSDPERHAAAPIPPWDTLSREHRESNRQQYDHIEIKLRSIGCRRVPATSNENHEIFEFTDQQIEILAKMEHNRWMAERLLSGCKYASPQARDDRARLHPDLVPWEQLSERSKEYDRKAVSRLPMVLKEVGEKIVQITDAMRST